MKMVFELFNLRAVVAFICLALPGFALGLEVEVYGGLGTGYAVQKQLSGDDTTDTAEKAYVGTRFLGPLGVELAYYNLGKYNNGSEEVTGRSAAMVLNLDIRGMTLFAKGGVIEWTETDLSSGVEISGEDMTYGAGINLPVDRHVLFRTELERFSNIGEDAVSGTPGKDMWLLTFGVNFKF